MKKFLMKNLIFIWVGFSIRPLFGFGVKNWQFYVFLIGAAICVAISQEVD